MDYGLLKGVFLSDPDQTNNFGKTIALTCLHIFCKGYRYVQIEINSKPPEWTLRGSIIPAQHVMLIKGLKTFNAHLLGRDHPWVCHNHIIKKQIRHWLARTIGYDIWFRDLTVDRRHRTKVIAADQIQMIFSPHLEYAFLHAPHTLYTEMVKRYKDQAERDEADRELGYQQYLDAQEEYENNAEWWDNLDEVELHNIENMMEG